MMNLSGVIIRALSFQLHRKVEILWHCFEFCCLKVILNYCTYVKKNRMHFPHDFLVLKVIHIGTLHIFTACLLSFSQSSVIALLNLFL